MYFFILIVLRQRKHFNSFAKIILLFCFLNEGQFKAGFVEKLKLKDGSVPIVHDPAAPPEVVSLTLYIYFFGVLFYTTTETISRRPWRIIPTCVKWASDVPFEAQPPQNQTYFKIILNINTYLKS